MDADVRCGDSSSGPAALARLAKHVNSAPASLDIASSSSFRSDVFQPGRGAAAQRGRIAGFNESQFVEEFASQSLVARKDVARFQPPKSELERTLIEQRSDWAAEFQTHKFDNAPLHNPEFERIFQGRPNPADWSQEFENQPQHHPAHAAFEEAFQQHHQQVLEEAWSQQFQNIQSSVNGFSATSSSSSVSDSSTLAQQQPVGEWEKEFAQFRNELGGKDDVLGDDFVEAFNGIWKGVGGGEGGGDTLLRRNNGSWVDEFEDDPGVVGSGPLGDVAFDADPVTSNLVYYTFESNNKYLSHPDPMAEGLELLREGGSLSEAALAFEAACQRDEHDSEAWMHLGMVQAENEKELAAIAALQRSVRENPANGTALMSLAVSYTNEGMDVQAYKTLERWIRTMYPALVNDGSPATDVFASSSEVLEEATRLFLSAARQGPQIRRLDMAVESEVDADVQVGLGVLFYNVGEFEKAVDCFSAALTVRPNDYLLWNRLGATLANSGNSEDAIEAYHKALELKPSYVRGRYNLGVSCINIGCYKEAVEHLLGALSMQEVPDLAVSETTHVSENLWDTLRRAFLMMDRRDLADLSLMKPDLGEFRKDFDF